MRQRKNHRLFYGVLLLFFLLAGYYISGLFREGIHLSTLEEDLAAILSHPFANYWNEKSGPCMALCGLIWLYFVCYLEYHNRNFMFGKEHGSASWVDAKTLTKQLKDAKTGENRIVSANLEYSLKALPNNNLLVIGSPGEGKTAFVLAPNLLRLLSSYVILDVKGDLLYQYGTYFRTHGYQVYSLNLKEKDQSDGFNPFVYIHSQEAIIRLIDIIKESTTPPDAMKGEPFWDEGFRMYLMALFCYVWLEYPMEKRSLPEVTRLMRYETEVLDENGTTRLSLLMDQLVQGPRGMEHPAYSNYKKLKEGAPETVASIVLMANAKLQLFEVPEVARIFEKNTIALEELGIGKNGDGKTKTALFLEVPDNDASFYFIVSMLYTFLIDVLLQEADNHYHGALPLRVEFHMDEYANGARPYRFESLITTLRSRNMAAILYLQSIGQLQTIHRDKAWETIMDACSAILFLGAGRGSLETHKYFSELLGSATIDKRTENENKGKDGSHSLGYDRAGRELMTPEEVGRMDRDHCIVLLKGYGPVYDYKNKPFEQPAFQEAHRLPPYRHPVFVNQLASGAYETLGTSGQMVPLSDASVAYYRQRQAQGEPVHFYTIPEDLFMEMDFFVEPELNLQKITRAILEHQLELEQTEQTSAKEEKNQS